MCYNMQGKKVTLRQFKFNCTRWYSEERIIESVEATSEVLGSAFEELTYYLSVVIASSSF